MFSVRSACEFRSDTRKKCVNIIVCAYCVAFIYIILCLYNAFDFDPLSARRDPFSAVFICFMKIKFHLTFVVWHYAFNIYYVFVASEFFDK